MILPDKYLGCLGIISGFIYAWLNYVYKLLLTASCIKV